VTTSQLVQHWATVPTVSTDEDTVTVRSVSVREWREIVAQQDSVPILLDEALLGQASQSLAAARGIADEVEASRHRDIRFVIDVTVAPEVQRLPYTALDDMRAVLTANIDFLLACQSKEWLGALSDAALWSPTPHDFLLPLFTTLP